MPQSFQSLLKKQQDVSILYPHRGYVHILTAIAIKMTLRIAHIDQQGEVLKKTEVNNEILPKA